MAVEIDPAAARVYESNWGVDPLGDITQIANDLRVDVPDHDVLTAGFPCQPFSKSGAQKGMDEARGTLFYNIANVLKAKRPTIVILENVRNLAGPRHVNEMRVIVQTLRELGYLVSTEPSIVSPHALPPSHGGRPQNRERVFITGTYVGPEVAQSSTNVRPAVTMKDLRMIASSAGWDPQQWDLDRHLLHPRRTHVPNSSLSVNELIWIDAWNEFVVGMREERGGRALPGFPLWAQYWTVREPYVDRENTPGWKLDFIDKNRAFFLEYREFITPWRKRHQVWQFPNSRQKLEWQAQSAKTLRECVMHFRPSGIRAKRATYLPALVAITQKSVIGSRQRKLSVAEAKRLQGLPDWFEMSGQTDAQSFRQLGNGVSIGAVWLVLQKHIERDREHIARINPDLLEVLARGDNPDPWLEEINIADAQELDLRIESA
jgi:DNA (cytosine-5)-methyltransferase 1